MRIIMMATGEFAVPTLRALVATKEELPVVVTRPLRRGAGRHRHADSPVRQAARELGLPLLDPPDINSQEAHDLLAPYAPELFIVCDYGQILSRETLGLAQHGGFNLHGSLLPRYRGAAPVNWAIYHGEEETGVAVIHMTPRLDAGPIVAREKITIGSQETAPELEQCLAEIGAPLVRQAVAALRAGDLQEQPQDDAVATRAPRLKKQDGEIDWQRSAKAIDCQIRAFKPWPKSFTTWQRGEAQPLNLIVEQAVPREHDADSVPGTVVVAEKEQLEIATGAGVLAIQKIQPAGKKVLTAGEFLRGYGVRQGDVWGKAAQKSGV